MGSIHLNKERGYWYVSWYHKPEKKAYKIYYYKGENMYSAKIAEKLLALMQSDYDRGIFRIENYIGKQSSDVIPYMREWLNAISDTLKPATRKDYHNSIEKHLKPFFDKHKLQLSEIQYDTLLMLMKSIKRSAKGKLNVMYCLRACLDYAWRARRIQAVPPFPRKNQYKIKKKPIEWLPEDRQAKVLNAIPADHQPIFWWLKLHYRREGEACALLKKDFADEIFTVQRTESARIMTDTTKTGEIHEIAMHEGFRKYMEQEKYKQKKLGIISPFYFVSPEGRKSGKPYHVKTLNDIWKKACKKVGEDIRCYAGTKHSSCSQFINEKGGTESELQMVTDHARLESVKQYAKIEVFRRKELMERGKNVE